MADRQVRIDLVADDRASAKIDDVADAAGDLEQVDPEVTVTADTTAADRAIADVDTDARQLTAQDREVVIRARMDDIKGELRELRGDLEQTGDKAQDTARQLDRIDSPTATGGNTRGQAIADLTGPLGEASGAASDFAGVFDGLGDIVADTAAKMGASQALAGRLAGAMGTAGIAVAAGAAIWSVWSAKADKAAQKAKELLEAQDKINAALARGDTLAAATELVENYGSAFDEAGKLVAASAGDVTRFITGQTDALAGVTDAQGNVLESSKLLTPEILRARDAYIAANGALDDTNTRVTEVADAMGGLVTTAGDLGAATGVVTGAMIGAKKATNDTATAAENLDRKWSDLKGTIDDDQAFLNLQDTFDDVLASAGEAWGAAQTGAADAETKTRDADQAVNDLKQSVIDYGREVLGLPPEQVTDILALIDNGSLADAETTLTWLTRMRTATINVVATGLAIGAGGRPAGTATTVTNNISLPVGSRGVDVLRTVTGQSRRSGTRYGAAVASRARR